MTEVIADQVLRVAIVYNPFKATEIDRHELVYRPGATLADYVGDLSDEGSWSVGYRGDAYDSDQWASVIPEAGEAISVVRIPQGGGSSGGKDIVRMVAMIAIAVVAMTIIGPWAAGLTPFAEAGAAFAFTSALAAATFTAAGMMVVNAVIPPPGLTKQSEAPSTYGVDGPKNTSREGPVVPVVFGRHRMGGNVVDLFTKNFGDDQYLYMRAVLSDGRIHSVSEIEINDQPIENFDNVEVRIALGDDDGAENDWFGEAIVLKPVAKKLTTAWTNYTTSEAVDRVRFDLLYPEGLSYRKDDGRILSAESDVAFEYRLHGSTGAYQPLGATEERTFLRYEGGTTSITGVGQPTSEVRSRYVFGDITSNEFVGSISEATENNPSTGQSQPINIATTPAGVSYATVKALAMCEALTSDASVAAFDMTVAYRAVGASTWVVVRRDQGTVERTASGFPLVYRSYSINFPSSGTYEVTSFGGTLTEAKAIIPSNSGTIHLVKAAEQPFRYTHESGILPRNRYDVRVRRLIADDGNKSRIDEVYLQDVGEIDAENVHYVGTANVSYRIKMGDQLNGIPKVTQLVEGAVVKQYDEDGNVVTEAYSQWPCWQVLDIFLNQDRGRGIKPTRVDFASFKEWEAHCIDKGLKFNGVFDSDSNVWDATQTICRVGHAQITRAGNKYSVVIDKPSEPVMLFNDSNIIEGTFTTNWLPLSERANEIQYTFYPEEGGFKEEMIRVVDPDVVNSGLAPKVAQITEIGVTNYEQARFNIEKQLRENKLLKKSISFDAPLEAIGLTLGDVAAVQHSSANYGKGIGTGRLKVGSTASTLALDCAVTMESGTSYRAMVIHSAVKRYTATVQNIVGNTIYVSGLPAGEMAICKRLVQGQRDTAILNIIDGSPYDRIVVDNAFGFAVGAVDLFDTDVIEERDVTFSAGEHETVVLASPLSAAPDTHAIWMLGPVETLKRLYRLRSIDGEGVHRRSLSFVQYDDQIYLPMGADITLPTPQPSPVPDHVSRLSISYPPVTEGQQTRVKAVVKWESQDARYAGADIYMALNGASFSFLRSVRSVKEFEIDFALGDDVQIRVVAFGTNDRRAVIRTAPTVAAVIEVAPLDLLPVRGVEAKLSSFKIDGEVAVSWTRSQSTNTRDYRVQWKVITEEEAEDLYIDPDTLDLVDETGYPIHEDGVTNPLWTSVVTQAADCILPRLASGLILIRVRAENGRSISPWSYHQFEVVAPALPEGVKNLRINGALEGVVFSGRDALFSWDDIVESTRLDRAAAIELGEIEADSVGWSPYQWADYEIKIFHGETLVRTEYTRSPNFSYTFEKNAADTTKTATLFARREFTFEVRVRSVSGELSAAVIRTVTNPPPALIEATAIPASFGASLSYQRPVDSDFGGCVVWAGEEGFTPGPANLVFRGGSSPTWSIPMGQTSHFRYAFYDVFDEQMTLSAEGSVTSLGIDGLEGLEGLGDRLDEIDEALGEVPGLIANANAELEEAIAGPTGYLTTRLDAIDRQIDITNPEAGSLGSRFLTYEGRDENGITRLDGLELAVGAPDGNGSLFGRLFTVEDIFRNPDGSITAERIESIETDVNTPSSGLKARVNRLDTITGDGTFVRATQLTTINTAISQRARTFLQAAPPSGSPDGVLLAQGDLWIDTDDDNRLYRYSGSGWVSVQAGTLRTFAQNEPPTAPLRVGELWFDTNDGNKLYRWNGTAWAASDDARVGTMFGTYTQTLQDISDLKTGKASVSFAEEIEAKANLKNRTFAQSTVPVSPVNNVALVHGDLWMDTSDGNKIYRWNGSTWVASNDARGQAALDELIAARGGSPTLAARFGSFTGTVADALAGKAFASDFMNLLTEVENARFGSQTLSARLTLLQSDLNGRATASQLDQLATRVDQKARTFFQPTAPTGSPNGVLLAAGDLWIDSDDGFKYYRYSGSAWVAVSAPTTKTYAQPSQPTGQVDGDLWFDTDDRNKQYRYDGSTWVLVQSSTTVSYAQPNAPTGADLKVGDLWCDTDDNNKLYRYDGASWVSVQALTTRTFAQGTAPGQPLYLGDMWFDTSDGNKLYRWAGTSWVPVADARIGQLRTDFTEFKDSVTDILNGTASATVFTNIGTDIRLRNRSFAQASPPVSPVNGQALSIGDLWMDTDDNNRIYRWSPNWTLQHDSRGADALQELANARNGYATLSARFGTITGTVADALAGKANASRVETLESTVNGGALDGSQSLSSRITFARDTAVAAEGKANAIFGMQSEVIAGGRRVLTGFSSINNGVTTEFAIRADKFSLVPSTGGARTEFSDGNWRVYDNNGVRRVRLGVW